MRALKSLRLLDLARNDIDLSLYEIYHQLIVPLKEIPKLQFLSLKSNPIEVKFPNFRYFVISELPRLEYYNYSKITKEVSCPSLLFPFPPSPPSHHATNSIEIK